jgi:protein-S-isoprenylcysteine O-methyltransferase Ste14
VEAAADVVLVCWAVFELGLRIGEALRGRGGRARGRGTRLLLVVSLGGTLGGIAAVHARSPAGAAAGAVVMGLGLAVRVWAVVVLGSAFRTTVEVETDQRVVTTGPYRRVRHVEEAELVRVLGEPYRAYQARTARLIPGIW